jgi:archaeosine synthase
MRWVERFEGLATLGPASLGPLRPTLPAVLDADPAPTRPLGPSLAAEEAPLGERRLVLGDGTASWSITVPVLAPEVAPATGGIFATSEPRAALAHAPFTNEALAKLREAGPELVILGNAHTLWNEGAPFVEALRALREGLGAEPLVWAPRVALPHRIPLLAYLGVDLSDTTEGRLLAAQGSFLDPTLGPRKFSTVQGESACDCAACAADGPDRLVGHALAMYRRAVHETREALGRGALRELVEARLPAEAANVEHLRFATRILGGLIEERAPVTATGRRPYVLGEAVLRPEAERFRRRLLERYRPPPSKTVLLLVPCSKTKPYRVSPSHRRFAHALDGLGHLERVHLVSVSSPMGLVPRELEDLPPARHYDVPVTGEWSAVERGWVTSGLAHLLRSGRYSEVIFHLDPVEYAFLREVPLGDVPAVWTLDDHRSTSPAALDRLRAETVRALSSASAVPGGFRAAALEEFASLARVQLGELAAARLVAAPVRLMGRPWFLRLTDGRQDLATVREERGLLHLTVQGALRVGDAMLRVDAEPTLKLQGDLFTPGVTAADRAIRVGDSVGIFQEGQLAGVGEAALPGRLMREWRRGTAVWMRHHRHASGDTAKADDRPSGAAGR